MEAVEILSGPCGLSLERLCGLERRCVVRECELRLVELECVHRLASDNPTRFASAYVMGGRVRHRCAERDRTTPAAGTAPGKAKKTS